MFFVFISEFICVENLTEKSCLKDFMESNDTASKF